MLPREAIACAVCDSLDARPLYLKFGLTVSRCVNCGLVFATPRATREEIWSRYSPDYFWKEYLPAHGVVNGQFDLATFDAIHAQMLRLIAQRASPPGEMLEVGTGAGFFLKAAARVGWHCSGIEVSKDAAEFARDRLGLDVRQASAEEVEHRPGNVDVVIMFEVIEHLLDPRRALRSVLHALRPGGHLLLSTPNFDALSRRVLGRQWAVISPGEHLYYFTESTLEKLLRREGFTEVTFVRQFPGFDLIGTMNAGCTHEAQSWRAKLYRAVVNRCGNRVAWQVRHYGLGDTLLCFANRPPH